MAHLLPEPCCCRSCVFNNQFAWPASFFVAVAVVVVFVMSNLSSIGFVRVHSAPSLYFVSFSLNPCPPRATLKRRWLIVSLRPDPFGPPPSLPSESLPLSLSRVSSTFSFHFDCIICISPGQLSLSLCLFVRLSGHPLIVHARKWPSPASPDTSGANHDSLV